MSKLEEKIDAICTSLGQIERILLTVPKATARTRDGVAELRREMRSYAAEQRALFAQNMAELRAMLSHKKAK